MQRHWGKQVGEAPPTFQAVTQHKLLLLQDLNAGSAERYVELIPVVQAGASPTQNSGQTTRRHGPAQMFSPGNWQQPPPHLPHAPDRAQHKAEKHAAHAALQPNLQRAGGGGGECCGAAAGLGGHWRLASRCCDVEEPQGASRGGERAQGASRGAAGQWFGAETAGQALYTPSSGATPTIKHKRRLLGLPGPPACHAGKCARLPCRHASAALPRTHKRCWSMQAAAGVRWAPAAGRPHSRPQRAPAGLTAAASRPGGLYGGDSTAGASLRQPPPLLPPPPALT